MSVKYEGNDVISIVNDGDFGEYYSARGKLEGVEAKTVDSHVYFSVIYQILFLEMANYRESFEKIYTTLKNVYRKSKTLYVDVPILEYNFGPNTPPFESKDTRKRIYYSYRCAIDGIALIEHEDYVRFTVVTTHWDHAHDTMNECIQQFESLVKSKNVGK